MEREEAVPPSEPSAGRVPCSTCDVQASGELDTASAGPLLELVRETAARCRDLTLDLSAVTFMDGAGLDALLAAGRTVRQRGGVLRLRSPQPSVRYVLELTGTEDAFEVVG
jgi:anti-anti-sigma factor